jgi:ADP-ribosyl-[dinitrogen reductase] hydrolase
VAPPVGPITHCQNTAVTDLRGSDPAQIAARLAGAVWGHLVGDAVGVPYEFKSSQEIGSVEFGAKGTYGQRPGTWSDDGALMLALLDSLLAAGFDPEDQAKRALDWYRRGAYTPNNDGLFDIGNTTRQALQAFEHGAAAEQAGPTDEHSGGDGSLMRILPLALVEREISDEELIEHAHRASRVTHGHERPQVVCALYSLLVRRLLTGKGGRQAALTDANDTLRAAYEAAPDGSAHLHALDHLESWSERGGRGRVWDSFWSAWDAFAGASSYRETIERAIAYGNDTDTTAAIAGGLAGIRFGMSGIPEPWLAGMRGQEVVEPLIARLIDGGQETSQSQVKTPDEAAIPKGARTSVSHPIRVDWVDLTAIPRLARAAGRLGMTFLPGKRDQGSAGRHWRDLETDARRLRDAHGATKLVLLVEDHELAALGVPEIAEVIHRHDIALLRFPIVDQGVPEDTSKFRRILEDIPGWIERGDRVVVACRGGLGRTGTFVALVLRGLGLEPHRAIELTRAARHSTIENRLQEAFIAAWKPGLRPIVRAQ